MFKLGVQVEVEMLNLDDVSTTAEILEALHDIVSKIGTTPLPKSSTIQQEMCRSGLLAPGNRTCHQKCQDTPPH